MPKRREPVKGGEGGRGERGPDKGGPAAGRPGGRGPGGRVAGQGGAGGGKPGPAGPVWPILRRLLGAMRPHAAILAGVILAALATTAVELAPPWIIRVVVDRFILAGQAEQVWWAAGGLLALSLLQGGVDFARLYLTAFTGQRIVFEIRNAIFEHLSRLSFSFYDRARTGDLMSRVTADVDVLNNFFGRAAVIVLTNLLTLLGILVVLLIWDWRLALVYLGLLPFIALGMWAYARQVQPAWRRVRRQLAALTSTLQESLAGILVLKLFGREAFEQNRVDHRSEQVLHANLDTARIASLWMPYASVVMGVGTALVLWVGGRNVIAGTISLGTLIGFATYIQMLLRPIRQTGMMLNVVMQSLAAAERVFEVLDTQPDVRDVPGAYPLPPIAGHVRFEAVTFSYNGSPSGTYALRDVDLEAAPGEMVALVGPSGAGKSTLVHLLPRFYDAQQGRITIDGHDVTAVTVKSLRDAIGIALQTVFLFDASIGENIAYGSPHATQHEIEWAASVVQMHAFIKSLPLGYGTPVGERGVRLSGGQRQRIALARVLLTDPRILILDEPTSSVDADTERRMQQALGEVRAGRTTFVIAHRLWTVQHADQILVLRDGQIVERAHSTPERSAHEALLAAGGFYRQVYALQFQAETLVGGEPAPAAGELGVEGGAR
ncbi:MAG: ABC transporter ATP-binding protein [Anaerolineae bacterium]|nr:ABC transporter ATP-binding protein [Anaerolineae bacterium]